MLNLTTGQFLIHSLSDFFKIMSLVGFVFWGLHEIEMNLVTTEKLVTSCIGLFSCIALYVVSVCLKLYALRDQQ